MSYILEALRKAERERSVGQVPDLATVCALPSPPRRRLWPWVLLVLALISNAAVLAVVFLPRENKAPMSLFTPAVGQPQPVAGVPAAVSTGSPIDQLPSQGTPASLPKPVAKAMATEPTPLMHPAMPVSPKPALLRKPEKPSTRTASLETMPSSPAAPARSKRPALARATPVESATSPALRPKSPAGLPDLPAEADPYAPGPPLAAAKAGLPDLPLETNRRAPELSMDIHVYSDQPDKRFVLINSRRYREGEQLSEGPLVEAITREGAVLRYEGQRFLLSVQR
jgi:general secretion pathway protein B